jgi:hypothetical protein
MPRERSRVDPAGMLVPPSRPACAWRSDSAKGPCQGTHEKAPPCERGQVSCSRVPGWRNAAELCAFRGDWADHDSLQEAVSVNVGFNVGCVKKLQFMLLNQWYVGNSHPLIGQHPQSAGAEPPRIGLTGLSKLHDFLGDTRCAFIRAVSELRSVAGHSKGDAHRLDHLRPEAPFKKSVVVGHQEDHRSRRALPSYGRFSSWPCPRGHGLKKTPYLARVLAGFDVSGRFRISEWPDLILLHRSDKLGHGLDRAY